MTASAQAAIETVTNNRMISIMAIEDGKALKVALCACSNEEIMIAALAALNVRRKEVAHKIDANIFCNAFRIGFSA
jgi:hypothetical protein